MKHAVDVWHNNECVSDGAMHLPLVNVIGICVHRRCTWRSSATSWFRVDLVDDTDQQQLVAAMAWLRKTPWGWRLATKAA